MKDSIKCPKCGQDTIIRKGMRIGQNRKKLVYHCECKAGHKFHQKLTGEFEHCDCAE